MKQLTERRISDLKEQVKQGGGIWVGVQETILREDLVLFNDRQSNTLALKVGQVTAIAVRNKITEKEKEYARYDKTKTHA